MLKMFTYMFDDKQFLKKYAVLFAFIAIANILINWSSMFSLNLNGASVSPLYYILFFIGVFTMFVPYGYSMDVLRAVMDNNTDLPSVNPKENFIDGLNVVLSGLLLLILLFIILGIMTVINNYTVTLFHGFLSYVFNTVTILLFFIVTFFGIAMCCNYVKKPSYFNFINFKKSADVINLNVAKYFKYYVITIILTVIVYCIIVLFSNIFVKMGYVGLFLHSMFAAMIWSYITYVLAYIFNDATKQ